MRQIPSDLLIAGWKYLHSIADESVCSDRTCFRCRLADILFEVEHRELELASEGKEVTP